MGLREGREDGLLDGRCEGTTDGLPVGCLEGRTDGLIDIEGFALGRNVEVGWLLIVGLNVGINETVGSGEIDGRTEGALDGFIETVGFELGFGENVGGNVVVGFDDGLKERVGDTDGFPLGWSMIGLFVGFVVGSDVICGGRIKSVIPSITLKVILKGRSTTNIIVLKIVSKIPNCSSSSSSNKRDISPVESGIDFMVNANFIPSFISRSLIISFDGVVFVESTAEWLIDTNLNT